MAGLTSVAGAITAAVAPQAAFATPPSSGTTICGNSVLSDPNTKSYWQTYASNNGLSFVEIYSGDNTTTADSPQGVTLAGNDPADTLFYLDTGDHTLGTSIYGSIVPGGGDVYVGADTSTVIDGQFDNQRAFQGTAYSNAVLYLTIKDFAVLQNSSAVNGDAGENWNFEYNTIKDNYTTNTDGTKNGAGLGVGSGDYIYGNCIENNGQLGLNVYSVTDESAVTGGPSGADIERNEIADNATNGDPGCGCSGGIKFWATYDSTFSYNYVHDNGSVGVWFDTNNAGATIDDNYISNNADEGIFYEISYNAQIEDNNLVDNGWVGGPASADFPVPAIYVSESGGNSSVSGNYSGSLTISGNQMTDNWDGVVLWENSNRMCGTLGACPLTGPDGTDYPDSITSCDTNDGSSATSSDTPDYFDNCLWETRNVTVEDNTTSFTLSDLPSSQQTACSATNNTYQCNLSGLFSNWGSGENPTNAGATPYAEWVIPALIVHSWSDSFTGNTYTNSGQDAGFLSFNQGNMIDWSTWTAGTPYADYTYNPAAAQDATGSSCSYNGGSC